MQNSSESNQDHSKDDNNIMYLTCDVKSTAIVKYAAVETPAKFSQLQCNTNLKQAPANWLRSDPNSEGLKGHYSFGKTNSEKFTSFNMADEFPDCIGDVDVVSDAENIKKLLKIPYSKAHVSMMVHRIRKTLLLDEFDIQRHLLRASKDDWQWLKKFYFEHVLQTLHNKSFPRKSKSRNYLQSKSMFSKFLYHSIADREDQNLLYKNSTESSDPSQNKERSSESPVSLTTSSKPQIADPTEKQKTHHHEFQRNVLWNFEDICMLIGTDMPIFGGGTHPAVSLRLGEMGKPINILTGLDYWLDNLMCNVPELVMCYHLDGIVQKYELLKTEDIPRLENSQFSPKVIKSIAQNILSFLKSNATKEGHTYWLFKGTNDDIVKLYDLTSLCTLEDKEENPFTIPVAILLYRVARNMKQAQDNRKNSGTIVILLKKFLDLMNSDKYDEVIISAYQMLADLYLSDYNNCFQTYERGGDCEEKIYAEQENSSSMDDDDENQLTNYLEVKTLCIQDKLQNKYREITNNPPVCGSLEERCRKALDNVAKGLYVLNQNIIRIEKEKLAQEHNQTNFPKPNHSIPLHFKNEEKDESIQVYYNMSDLSIPLHCRSWQKECKKFLLSKALQAYNLLADSANNLKKFGRALRYIRLALYSYSAAQVLCENEVQRDRSIVSSVLMAAGDCHLMLSHHNQNLDAYKEEYDFICDMDKVIMDNIKLEIKETQYDWACDFSGGIESSLLISLNCYEEVLDILQQNLSSQENTNIVLKRLGNIRNEMGVYYMNLSSTLSAGDNKDISSTVQETWKKSFTCFEAGIRFFERIKDVANMALLNSNMARLMRLCASTSLQPSMQTNREFTVQERHYYKKAIKYYQAALKILEDPENFPQIWDSINWELSSTYFIMATQLQDCAPLTTTAREEVEQEVIDLMMKALTLCDLETSERQPLCQYRAATIHYRIASLYHSAYRNQLSDQKTKQLRTSAESHYCQASLLFQLVDHPIEYLRVQLERVAMCEFHLNSHPGFSTKVKILQSALDYIVECHPILKAIEAKLKEEINDLPGSEQDQISFKQQSDKLLGILEQRLQFILLNLIKTFSNRKSRGNEDQLETYKKLYGLSLQTKSATDLWQVLCKIQESQLK